MDPDDASPEKLRETHRRRFLKGVAAAGSLIGVGVTGTAQQEPEADFVFGGDIGAWRGQSPDSIAGKENPTIELQPGETYTVAWENLDGLPHNFVIIDGAGNEVVRSPVIEKQGFVQTVEFDATEAMTEYFCEVHPRSMRGAVDTGVDTEQPQNIVPEGESIGLQQVADGLSAPLGFEVAPGEQNRRYIVDQPGQVYVHTSDGLRDRPFLDIGDRLVDLGIEHLNGYDERGLLGLAFHPDYQENGRVFVRYSAPVGAGTDGGDGAQPREVDHIEVLSEFQVTGDGERVDPESEQVLLEIPSPQDNHNGGAVDFGPEDGYLYTSVGDGGDADDTGPGHVDDWYDANGGGNGQDTTENLLGSILRIDVDGQETVRGEQKQYAIPDDNPLVGLEGHLDEHYAWGFRNPWRMSFDSQGRFFVADAGQNLYEEVDLVQKGGNYGWNVKEASHCFSTETPNQPPAECPDSTPENVRSGEPLIDPIIEYRHRLSTTAFIDGSVVVGGYVYESDTIGHLQNQYVFGNWSGTGVRDPEGEIFVATPPEQASSQQTQFETMSATQPATIALGGEVQAWTGRAPDDIAGEQNPTLTLVPGETYQVTWENLDGAPHNFAIWDANEQAIVSSEIMSEAGTTQTVEFEATEEMATYVCEVHPSSMRGSIQFADREGAADTPTATPGQTPTETPEQAPTQPDSTGEPDRAEDIDPQPALWSVRELTIAGADDGTLGAYVYGFGRDAQNELYVLTSGNFTPFGDTGSVYRLVPAGEGDDITGGESGPTGDEGGDGNATGTPTSGRETPVPESGGGGGDT